MNYKLEKFWNLLYSLSEQLSKLMNYKLEKFWNSFIRYTHLINVNMNYKLEKFWNGFAFLAGDVDKIWTINLKSFEIILNKLYRKNTNNMNYKLEKFWNL